MSQTSYNLQAGIGFRGLLADPNFNKFALPLANGAAAAQGFGILVKRDATNPGEQFDIFSGAGQKPVGITIHTHNQQNPSLADPLGIDLLEMASLLRSGRIWVPVEEAITLGDPVYFRHTSGTGTEIGAFRNDADGVAEVSTLTPTPADDTMFTVDAHIGEEDYHFEFMSGTSATATQICDGIRAAMALDAAFTARVVATGTATLILTSQQAGLDADYVSSGPGLFTIVETTASAPTCDLLPGAEWIIGSAAAGVAELEINIP
jgi:hypothetical protein